jgi:hypothetical protein
MICPPTFRAKDERASEIRSFAPFDDEAVPWVTLSE